MPNNYDQEKQKALETETLCYKQFMKVAKKISYLQYGKWEIVPSAIDPLRKFTLEKDCGWFKIRLALHMEQFYHRADYSSNRYGYRAVITMSGLFKDMTSSREHVTNLGMKLKPRMTKKLMKAVDEVIVPQFYLSVGAESQQRLLAQQESQALINNISLVKGLEVEQNKNSYDRHRIGQLSNCPFEMIVYKEHITLSGEFTYDALAKMAEQMGWGK